MSALIILGNTNPFTFANSIVAANDKAIKLFQEPLKHIFAIHSNESSDKLKKETDWIQHIESNGVSREVLNERIIEVASEEESIKRFTEHLTIIVRGLAKSAHLIVDLTNSTTFYKNLLSIAAYVLDLRDQYLIDIVKLSQLTSSREFLPVDVLRPCYVQAPDSTHLDKVAHLNLTEIKRYKREIEEHTKRYVAIDQQATDKRFFEDNLAHSIRLKLEGDQNPNNAVYRIATSAIAASIEDLMKLLTDKFVSGHSSVKPKRQTLGQRLGSIEAEVNKMTPANFDKEFFEKFNTFMLYLRNSTTHKPKVLTSVERFKADLAIKMSFPFIEFYTDVVYPILSGGKHAQSPKPLKVLSSSDLNANEVFYFGLDGDDTGTKLENNFLESSDEDEFRILSESVTKAVAEIGKLIQSHHQENALIFAAGDDLLFKGRFDGQTLHAMQKMYKSLTSGLTCSIGFGRTIREVYLALKLAKTEPGKNSIVGIVLQ